MVLVYTTKDDLVGDWLDEAPANVDRLIRAASTLVRNATRAAMYDITPAGAPSDDDVAAGFRDAVCTQVATWVSLGIDPAKAGIATEAPIAAKSLGGRSVTYDTAGTSSVTAMQAKAKLTTTLTDDAAAILAALPIWAGVQVYG